MDLNQYQIAAARTINPLLTYNERLTNAAMGLAGEAGEVVEHVKKFCYHGHTLDKQAAAKELGDLLWYLSEMASTLNLNLSDVAQANIFKLQQRYPDRFSAEHSRNRIEALG